MLSAAAARYALPVVANAVAHLTGPVALGVVFARLSARDVVTVAADVAAVVSESPLSGAGVAFRWSEAHASLVTESRGRTRHRRNGSTTVRRCRRRAGLLEAPTRCSNGWPAEPSRERTPQNPRNLAGDWLGNHVASRALPLLGVDVWQRAYYLDYWYRRDPCLQLFCDQLVDWNFVARSSRRAQA
jgi:hypothetical protein